MNKANDFKDLTDGFKNHNYSQKKIAAVNDLSGFGRCSLTVAIPIISAMGFQCCPLPTAILSNHTGYEKYFFDDYTKKIQEYYSCWQKLNLVFDGICTGFLGSEKQIEIVIMLIKSFKKNSPKCIVTVDPVMGDHGIFYSTFTNQMCEKMKKLVCQSDVCTPNLTEACLLTDTPFDQNLSEDIIFSMADNLKSTAVNENASVIITGVKKGDYICNYISSNTIPSKHFVTATLALPAQYSGTGDVFSSLISCFCTQGIDIISATEKASSFVAKCVSRSIELKINPLDGVCFEEFLSILF